MTGLPTGPNLIGSPLASGLAGQVSAERVAQARQARNQREAESARRDFRDTYQGVTDVESTEAIDPTSDNQKEAQDERKRKCGRPARSTKPESGVVRRLDLTA